MHGCYHPTSDKFPGHCCESNHFHLQPENILCMTKSGNRIKIIDFGLARKFEPMRKLQVDSLPTFLLNRLSRHWYFKGSLWNSWVCGARSGGVRAHRLRHWHVGCRRHLLRPVSTPFQKKIWFHLQIRRDERLMKPNYCPLKKINRIHRHSYLHSNFKPKSGHE